MKRSLKLVVSMMLLAGCATAPSSDKVSGSSNQTHDTNKNKMRSADSLVQSDQVNEQQVDEAEEDNEQVDIADADTETENDADDSENNPIEFSPAGLETQPSGSDLADSGEDLKVIPEEVNHQVYKWVKYFTGRGKAHMERYLSRSNKYLPLMKSILKREGLPEDLVFIALIESGFNAHARSTASAVGYWQFIRGTGRRYGLRVDSFVDERRDFEKATLAAADYFKGLYSLFGSWYLAIASYNVGENKIKRLVMKYHTRDFWKLAKLRRLPKETKNYVPKFLAARMIAKDPVKYGFNDIEYMQPLQFKTVELRHSVDIRKMAENMKMDFEDLQALNPAYKRGVALDNSGQLVLRVPQGYEEVAQTAARSAVVVPGRVLPGAASLSTFEDDFTAYRVRRGDTMASIARKFGTSVRALRRLNHFKSRTRLIAGRRIRVPGESLAGLIEKDINSSNSRTIEKRSSASTSSVVPTSSASTPTVAASGQRAVAAASAISASATASSPSQTPDSKVKPSSTSAARYHQRKQVHVVRRGDTLIDIANRYRVSLAQLASHNQLTRKGKIFVGMKINIP